MPKEPKPTVGVLPGWYFYQHKAIEVMDINGVMTARGYDFDLKSEWRLPVSELMGGTLIAIQSW